MGRGRRRRIRRGEKEWAEIIRQLEGSRLSSAAFCRRQGLALSSLQRWRQRVGGQGSARFVELVPAAATVPNASSPGWSLELTLPNGASLRLQG